MPIEFTHFLSGVMILGVIGLFYRRKLTHPFFYVWELFTFMLPDLDHLAFWDPAMISHIFPTRWEDLFEGLFTPRSPFLLHFWGFPLAVTAVAIYGKFHRKSWWKYLAVLAVGWATHLALDGVMLV